MAEVGRRWMISWRPCLHSARRHLKGAATGAMEGVALEEVGSPSALAGDAIRGALGGPQA